MNQYINNLSSYWNSICNNDDTINIWQVNGMVNPVSDSEEFHFSEVDISCIMSYFGN